MAELDVLSWDLDGLAMGGATGFDVLEVSGLEDASDHEITASNRQGDGTVLQRVRMRDRPVEMTIGLTDTDLDELEEQKDALRAVTSRKADGLSPRLLRWRHNGVAKRVEYRPQAGTPLVIPGDEHSLVNGHLEATVRLLVSDPFVYADEIEEEAIIAAAGDPHDFTIDNPGTVAADPRTGSATLGSWQLTLTAGGGGCENPYFQHMDFDERWTLAEVIGAAGVASVGWDRITRRNTTIRSASVKGPGGCPVPLWPWLRPGENDLRVGCTAGSVTGTFEWRPAW